MKITKEGLAVIEGDEYLSADIIAQGRLDVARGGLLQYKQYIPEGGVVVDVGACLGDYTATFSEFVGPAGMVLALEPNPEVYSCLAYNTKHMLNVTSYQIALGAAESCGRIDIDHRNIGASHIVFDLAGPIRITTLDSFYSPYCSLPNRLDFIKIDAEGFEPLVLAGSAETICKFWPVLLVEIDQRALGQHGFRPVEVHRRLDALGYDFPRFDGAHGDILCVPKERT